MIVTIPYKPRFPQTLIHPQLESHRFSVLVAHRRLGKSVLAINHLIKAAVQNTLVAPRYAYMAPYLKQAKLIAWDYLKRYTAPIPGVKSNESELYVELPNKARIWLFGADNPEAGRGTYWDGVVLDEYAQIKPEVFSEIIRPSLSDRNGWAVFMGTPKGQNQFFDIYNQALKRVENQDKNWWAGLYRADETNVIPSAELAQVKQVISDSAYRQEFLCDFTAAADNILIPIDLVSLAASRGFKDGELDGAVRVMGVDPARYGDDKSVIVRRQGLQMLNPLVFSKLDNMTLAGRVAQEITVFKPDAVFIDAGQGQGVIDRLRQLGYEVQEVHFGGRALNEHQFVNRRSEMWDQMREWLEQGGAIPNDSALKSDLVTPTYDFDLDRMRLESKDKIKERLGRSPDIGDALALTFAAPVNNKRSAGRQKLEFANSEYDPLAEFNTPARDNVYAGVM